VKVTVIGDSNRKGMVVNLWLSGGGIGTEVNLTEKQAIKLMADITKAMHECRLARTSGGKGQ